MAHATTQLGCCNGSRNKEPQQVDAAQALSTKQPPVEPQVEPQVDTVQALSNLNHIAKNTSYHGKQFPIYFPNVINAL